MWMAATPPPANPVHTILCSYLSLPGYGNNWDQSFCTTTCLAISGGPTPNLDIAFRLKYDSEPSYDYTALEYTTDCSGNTGWTEIDGGNPLWTAADSLIVVRPVPGRSGPREGAPALLLGVGAGRTRTASTPASASRSTA